MRKLERLTGCGESSIRQEDLPIPQEEIHHLEEEHSLEGLTQKNTNKVARKQKTKQTSVRKWARIHNIEKEAIPEIKKRKTNQE